MAQRIVGFVRAAPTTRAIAGDVAGLESRPCAHAGALWDYFEAPGPEGA